VQERRASHGQATEVPRGAPTPLGLLGLRDSPPAPVRLLALAPKIGLTCLLCVNFVFSALLGTSSVGALASDCFSLPVTCIVNFVAGA
jgi:hypothetical protein